MATPTTAGRVIIGQGITVKGDIKNCEEVIVRGFFDAGNVEAKTVVVEADGESTKNRNIKTKSFVVVVVVVQIYHNFIATATNKNRALRSTSYQNIKASRRRQRFCRRPTG